MAGWFEQLIAALCTTLFPRGIHPENPRQFGGWRRSDLPSW